MGKVILDMAMSLDGSAAGTRNVAIGGGPTTAQGFVEAPDATHLRYRVLH